MPTRARWIRSSGAGKRPCGSFGRGHATSAVMRRARTLCPAGAGRRDTIRRGRPGRGSCGLCMAPPPEPQRAFGPTPGTAPAQSLPSKAAPVPPRRGPRGHRASRAGQILWCGEAVACPLRIGPALRSGSQHPVPRLPPPSSRRTRRRRAPPGTPHERITHSRVHILLHPCYDRTRRNRIHY